MTEIKWIVIVLILCIILIMTINSTSLVDASNGAQKTYFGLNLFLEILVFFTFSTFVVFGFKGFFEKFSQKSANVIILTSGILLTGIILVLAFQILF